MPRTRQMHIARIKQAIKQVLAHTLFASGVLPYLARRKLRGRCVVLMYHRVLPDESRAASMSHGAITVGRNVFRQHMQYLQTHFIPLDQTAFMAGLQAEKTFADQSCLITFDDGWKDNYTHAWPILRELQVPATIFLSSGFIGTAKRFWQERLTERLLTVHELVQHNEEVKRDFGTRFQNTPFSAVLNGTGGDVREAIATCTQALKAQPVAKIDTTIATLTQILAQHAPVRAEADDFMDWEQVRQMQQGAISFGAHGVNHRIMTRPDVDLQDELIVAKRVIEAKTRQPVTTMSYPNGNYNADVVARVRRAGYRAAFSVEPGHVRAGDDPYTVKRININGDSAPNIPMLLARIVGLW